MKRLLVIPIIALFMMSCGNSKNENKKAESVEKEEKLIVNEEEKLVKVLDYKSFIKEVWDIEKYPDSFAFKGDNPCIIDFYADWCGPCKKIAPIMEELAKEYKGKLTIYKVNTDNERKLATIFKIKSIPTVFFMPMTGQPRTQVGALSKEDYKNIIEQHLLK